MTYAGAEFWDQFFQRRRESGRDLDWAGLWTKPFLTPLREAGVRTILELGCGTGNDTARLASEGYSVTATDVSAEAIGQARAKFGSTARFMVADMTQRLPLADGEFDEPDYVAEECGQTMHFFSEAYLRELLGGWQQLQLTPVPIRDPGTGEPFKHVWRGIARR